MEVGDISWLAWWYDADWVVRSVFIVLLMLSVLSWTVIFFKTWQYAFIFRHERRIRNGLRSGKTLFDVARNLPGSIPSAHLFSMAMEGVASLKEFDRDRAEAHFSGALRERRLDLENNLTMLATIGNTAPFIGLFGTVWGIMHALQGLGGDEALSMDMIAGPVAEALVATAAGLFAAIPAVVGYNLLLRRLRKISGTMEGNAVHAMDAFIASAEKRV